MKKSTAVLGFIAAGVIGWYLRDIAKESKHVPPVVIEQSYVQPTPVIPEPIPEVKPEVKQFTITEEQVDELSDLVSKATGVKHTFQLKYVQANFSGSTNASEDGRYNNFISLTNIDSKVPGKYINKIFLTQDGVPYAQVVEMKQGVTLVDYGTTAHAGKVVNKLKNPRAFAMVAKRRFDGQKPATIDEIATLATKPVFEEGKDASYYVVQRSSEKGVYAASHNLTNLDPVLDTYGTEDRIEIRYEYDRIMDPIQLSRTFAPADIRRIGAVSTDDSNFLIGYAIEQIRTNRSNRFFIESQTLVRENGVWVPEIQWYGSPGYPEIVFKREDGKMKLSDFIVGP